MRRQVDTRDAAVADIARRQHGIVSVAQLQTVGLDAAAVTRRVRAGRLHRIHRGVYAVGHTSLSMRGHWMAAVLALGDSAALSHRSAAELWGLLRSRRALVDVSVSGESGRATRPGIRLHRTRTLTADEITRRYGIPITTPTRTIADLRRVATESEVNQAIRQAGVLGLRLPEEGPDPTRSELERVFLQLCERHGLPLPQVNSMLDSLEVDFLWREQRLVVETDGYRYHRGRAAFENDRSRDLRLRALGFDVVRLTYRQVVDEPTRIVAILRASL